MFRVQDNVPEIYVNKSRDFQLFCRLYDIIITGVRYSIESMEYLTDSKNCNIEVTDLLQKKLGIFRTIDVSDRDIRFLLDAFPYVIRNKGNVYAIESILRVFQRITADPSAIFSVDYSKFNEQYTIVIEVTNNLKYLSLLRDILNYVVPTGYLVSLNVISISPSHSTLCVDSDVQFIDVDKDIASTVVSENAMGDEGIIGAVGTTPVK